MLPVDAFGFHFGKETTIDPPAVISWVKVIVKVDVVNAPTTFEADVTVATKTQLISYLQVLQQ